MAAGEPILIVEDDPEIGPALNDVLAELGYEPSLVRNGREALDHLHEGHQVDLILLDLMMPVMNGFEFRAAQLRDPAYASIPVVVITAHVDDFRKIEALGVSDWARKPVELEELVAKIDRALHPERTS